MQNMTAKGLRLGDVTVIEFNDATKQLALAIQLDCKPTELNMLSSKEEASDKIQRMFKYLIAEGFIRPMPITRWHINAFGVAKFNQTLP